MGKPKRLELVARVDIPIVEASGIASRTTAAGERHVLVVGDRTNDVAVGRLVDGALLWQVLDLDEIDGWPPARGESQFEAIAADGGSLVAVMIEDPPVVLVADADRRRLVCRITLDDQPALDGMWDESNSRGEGLVLLRGGRLLVAKEKHPAALIEFAPPGTPPRGIGPDDFLAPAERWDAPTGEVTFSAVAVWVLEGDAADRLRDVSAIGETDQGDLWLLSDQSHALGQVRLTTPLPPGGGTIDVLDALWRLPKHVHKPEGLATLGAGRFFVCLDTNSTDANGIVIALPDRA